MIFHLIITVLAGYGAHFSYYLTSRLGLGWSQLSAYTLGVLFCLPFVVAVHDELEDISSPRKRLVVSYLLAYLMFGIGTAAGWVTHPIQAPSIFVDDRNTGA
jgi:hypothetical protein